MKCSQALEGLLEADRSVLKGRGDSPLAQHILGCGRCQGIAEVVLTGEDGLFEALADRAPRVDAEKILEAAGSAPEKSSGVDSLRLISWPWPRPVLPALLSAAAVLLLFLFSGDPPLPGPEYSLPQNEILGLEVQVPAGRSAAVLATNDPDIAVLWLF